jgi:hypothetical protein
LFFEPEKGRSMSAASFRRRLARASLLTAVLGAWPAYAGDKPATPEGALELKAFFAKFLPAAVAGTPPLLAVTPEGSDYLVSMDLSAVNELIKHTGTSYDPATILYRLAEQDDGKWRVSMDSLPRISFRSNDATGSIAIDSYRQSALIDPAIAWILSGSANAAKGMLKFSTPKLEETVDFETASADLATTVKGDGSVSTTVKETIADFGVQAKGFAEKNAPINWSARVDKALVDVGVDGLMSRKAFDLWSLIAAHPDRGELAEHEAELKGLLRDIATPGLRVAEGLEAQRTVITSAFGAIAVADVKYEIGAANLGPQSALNVGVAADGLSLPAGLAPPNVADLIPSKINLAVAIKGFDLAAGVNQAIAAMSLKGDGPLISDADSEKVSAAFLNAGPLRIEIAPSRIASPSLTVDLDGVVRYAQKKASADLTIHARGFDKAMAALNSLGADMQEKMLPVLAMAKGLAKTESDGALTWVVQLGDDRSMKVNGIPLGRAPD